MFRQPVNVGKGNIVEMSVVREFVNGVSYKPGWTFEIVHLDSIAVVLKIEFDAPDSDVKYAPDYTTVYRMSRGEVIVHSDCADREVLAREMFLMIHRIEIHEMREFFAINGTRYDKPVHPHVEEGKALMYRWGNALVLD